MVGFFYVIYGLFVCSQSNSQLEAMRQKSSCSLVMSKAQCRDSGSTLSLERATVERLGFEAWRRVEVMQLGTCNRAAGLERRPIYMLVYNCNLPEYLQRCFDIFVVVLGTPFPWKSPLFLGAVKCRCLESMRERKTIKGNSLY